MERPQTRYVKDREGRHLAYWTIGEGPRTLIWVPNFFGNADVIWDFEPFRNLLASVAGFTRVVWFDQLGAGVSDPVSPGQLPSMEGWMDGVRVVMDAAGIERASLLGHDAGGPIAMLFAAAHPERTESLVLVSSFARVMRADDIPWGLDEAARDRYIDFMRSAWGTGAQLRISEPSRANDPAWVSAVARWERLQIPPAMFGPILEMICSIDVRDVLPSIRVPVLIVHLSEDRSVPVEHGRYLARSIVGSRYVELPGSNHLPGSADWPAIVSEVEEFITGSRARHTHPDRVLATLLFTDIVDSTRQAAELGDRRWRQLLERHYEIVRAKLEEFRGREVKTLGDGFLATFDGPARAIRCAFAIGDESRASGLNIRAGVHTGECEIMGDDLGGIAVHIAARISALAGPGEVLVSRTVTDLVAGSGLSFDDHGTHALKGVPGSHPLFRVRA